MPHEHPLDGLHRDSGRSPRRTVAKGNVPRVCETRFQRRTPLPIENDDFVPESRKLICGCDANNARAKNGDFQYLIQRFA